MFNRTRNIVTAGLFTLAALSPALAADFTTFTTPTQAVQAPAQAAQTQVQPAPVAAQPAQAAAQPVVKTTTVTPEQIATSLTNLGYEYRNVAKQGDAPVYEIVFERDGWKYVINVSPATDGGRVYFDAVLRNATRMQGVTSDFYAALLKKNWDLAPTMFMMGSNGALYLSNSIDASAATNVGLRKAIDGLATKVRETGPLWQDPTPVAKAEAKP